MHLENAIRIVQTEYFAFLVAIVTDASGECRKARRILALKYPEIVFLDCYAHQVRDTLSLAPDTNTVVQDKSRCWGLF